MSACVPLVGPLSEAHRKQNCVPLAPRHRGVTLVSPPLLAVSPAQSVGVFPGSVLDYAHPQITWHSGSLPVDDEGRGVVERP